MHPANIRRIRFLARAIALLTLGLVALGAFVRATGAGLACPDWPLCFGHVIPPLVEGVTQEVVHRYLASIVGVLTLIFAFETFRVRKSYPKLWAFALLAMTLLAVQIVFGGLTVTMQLNPYIVTTHLALGTLFLQLFALVGIQRLGRPFGVEAWQTDRSFRNMIGFLIGLTALQLVLGGFVGSSGAALACPDFPTCFGEYLPSSESVPQLVQMSHRLVGIFLLVGVVVARLLASRAKGLASRRKGHLGGVIFMLVAQITLGVVNVVYLLPVAGTILHLVVAQLILLALASLYVELSPALNLFEQRFQGGLMGGDRLSSGERGERNLKVANT